MVCSSVSTVATKWDVLASTCQHSVDYGDQTCTIHFDLLLSYNLKLRPNVLRSFRLKRTTHELPIFATFVV